MYKFGQRIFKEIKSNEMRGLFESFTAHFVKSTKLDQTTKGQYLGVLLHVVEDVEVEEFSWNTINHILENDNLNRSDRFIAVKMCLRLLLFSIDEQVYKGSDRDEYIHNRKHIGVLVDSDISNFVDKFVCYNSCPSSVICWHYGRQRIATLVNSTNQYLLSIFREYIDTTIMKDLTAISLMLTFFSNFEIMIYPDVIRSENDFNDETFFRCLGYVSKIFPLEKNQKSVASRVVVFFQWLMTKLPSEVIERNFVYINTVSLSYVPLHKKVAEGYRIVRYSPYDEPKCFDRMLLLPSSNAAHVKGESYRLYPFDISMVRSDLLKKWYTDFYWKSHEITLLYRTKILSSIRNFLVGIDGVNETGSFDTYINDSSILSFISNAKSRSRDESSIARELGTMKKFLSFLESEYGYEIKPILKRLLVYKDSKSTPNKERFTADELEKIIKYLFEKDRLFALALSILSKSELRAESIINLKVNCLVKSTNSKAKEDYFVMVSTKTSNNEEKRLGINRYVKGYIEEVQRITEEARKTANSYDKDYLFLYMPIGKLTPRRLRPYAITRKIIQACDYLGIESKGCAGTREFYMQSVSNYLTKNNIDPQVSKFLTDHTFSRHFKDYDSLDIVDFCQKCYRVNIGNVYLRGTIAKEVDLGDEAPVEKNCGFCSRRRCNFDGTLSCFMCDGFVTTISCIPFYRVAIADIDKEIVNEHITHQKDFLVSKKKLMVGYLSRLLVIKGEEIKVEQYSE